MGWTLTAVVARAADVIGGRSRWTSAAAVARASGLAQRGTRAHDTVFARVFARRLAQMSAADRKALGAAISALGHDRAVIERAMASGAPIAAIAGLAARWDALPAQAKAMVRNPLGDGGVGPVLWASTHAKQIDQTTCGAASMAMMLMCTDPFVAWWVATGQTMDPYMPPEVLRVASARLPAESVPTRWGSLQRAIHEETTRRGLGLLPWPQSLGTPPWRVDNVTRCAGLKFRGVLVDDAKPAELGAMLAHASAALRDGIPVPMFTAGDSSLGVDTALPRHVVLLTERRGDDFHVYEPGSGAVHAVTAAQLAQPHGKLAVLGNWTRIAWLVLPSPHP